MLTCGGGNERARKIETTVEDRKKGEKQREVHGLGEVSSRARVAEEPSGKDRCLRAVLL